MESNGSLWLQSKGREDRASGDEDRLELRVLRRIVDDIPLLMTVRIELEIAGSARELTLGPVISQGDKTDTWTAMSLDSPLPARLEPDGKLRIQVRPGSWTLVLTARHQGETVALTPRFGAFPPPAGKKIFSKSTPTSTSRPGGGSGTPAASATSPLRG